MQGPMHYRAVVTTKVIDEHGQIDDETAIPHEWDSGDPAIAIGTAFDEAKNYITGMYESNGTDAFDLTFEMVTFYEE